MDEEDLTNEIEDTLWIDDSVTGNASGSYTFNSYKAKEYVLDNMELLIGIAEEFGWDGIIKDLQAYNWELLDVTIRCCTLREALNEIIDELIEEHRKRE